MGVPCMTSSRAAGWPLLVGAALLFLAQIPQSVLFGGDDTSRYAQHSLWVPTNLVSVAGAILLLWGLPILYANARARGLGWLGGVGSFLIFIGGSMVGIIVEAVNSFLFFVGIGWLGYEMITMPRAEEALSS